MKINLSKFRNNIYGFIIFCAQNIAVSCIIIFILSLVIGAGVFYYYFKTTQKISAKMYKNSDLKVDIYQNIKDIWQKDDEIFKSTDSKKYKNIFDTGTNENITTPTTPE